MQLAPRHVLLNMDLQFRPEIPTEALFETVDNVERRIREAYPDVRSVFVEVEALRGKQKAGG